MKKPVLLSVVFALLLSLAFPAHAVTQGSGTLITAGCSLPEILVTVPNSGQIFLNPYQIPIEIDGTMSSQQIVFAPVAMENKSEVPLAVTMTVVGNVNPESTLRLLSYSTREVDTNRKYAFLYCELHAASSMDAVVWDSKYNEDTHAPVLDGREVTRRNVITLSQADQQDHFGVFRLTGDCTPNPIDPWSEDIDTIDVKIAFSFKPLEREMP